MHSASISLTHHRLPGSDQIPSLGTIPSMLSSSGKSDSSFEIVPGIANFDSASYKVNLPCYMTKGHTKNKRFWPGNDVMDRIERALLPLPEDSGGGLPVLRTFVLHGIGGVGKTEIATEFVHRHQDKFDAIFFLHADVRSRLSNEYIRIADHLGLEHDGDADSAQEIVKDWLANPVKIVHTPRQRSSSFQSQKEAHKGDKDLAKWMIVYDNADDPEVLLDSWPEDGRGAILVTSRDPMAKDSYYFGKAGLEMQPLSVDAGADFLRSMTGTEDAAETSKSSQEIARRLDGLPLAIEQIGAIIRRKRLTLPAFEIIYKDEAALASLQVQRIAQKRGYEHSIASVWALQDLPVGSSTLLKLLSFLGPDCIPSDLLKKALQKVPICDLPKSEMSYTDDLGRLLQSSLVSQSSGRTELRIHRLCTRCSTRTNTRSWGNGTLL